MKSIKLLLSLILQVAILLGILAIIVTPIFLMISLIVLRTILPLWFSIIGYICASSLLIFEAAFLINYNNEKNESQKNQILK